MADERQRIADNVAEVRQRIAAAARRSGRTGDDVLLVAVTKYVGADVTQWLVDAGCQALGESRPQDLWAKADAIDDPAVEWHLIGHLQRNKIRRTLPRLSWLHSVDSRATARCAGPRSGSPGHGRRACSWKSTCRATRTRRASPSRTCALGGAVGALAPLWKSAGLMAMSAFESDAESARRDFVRLRALRDAMQRAMPAGDRAAASVDGDEPRL